jgi:phosphoribosylglycinamide formyltransferase-1
MPLKRIAVLVSGSGSNLQSLMDAIACGEIKNAQIVVVISDHHNAYALERANKAGIKAVYVPRELPREQFDAKIASELENADAEYIVLAGYLSIVNSELVAKHRNKIVNIHPSLIPSFCGKGMFGKRVHRAVLEYGCKITGATVHIVDEGMDTGPIILQESVPVMSDDDVDTLAARVLVVEHKLLTKAVRLLVEDGLEFNGRNVRIREDKI